MRQEIQGINPAVALEWVTTVDEIPEELIPEVSSLSTRNPVSNTGRPYLFFTDSALFSPAAKAFEESLKTSKLNPQYTHYLEGTIAYKAYWKEEKRRCIEGYEPEIDGIPCGLWIPGKYYFYLNFCRIQKLEKLPNGRTKKSEQFPDFLSMDYYWYMEQHKLEFPTLYSLSEYEKKHSDVAKARQLGFSFKEGGEATYIYSFIQDGKVLILSQYGDKGTNLFKMCLVMIDFLNKYTEFRQPWIQRSMMQNKCIIQSGAEEDIDGVKTYKGIRTVIETASLKDKPDAAASRNSVTLVIFEESGQIIDLKEAIEYTDPIVRAGDFLTGRIVVMGTGGDMESGAKPSSEIFFDPESYGFASYNNIYEQGEVTGKCGWFVDALWYRPSTLVVKDITYHAVDKNGNAHRWVAEISIDKERKIKQKGDRATYSKLISQKCKTPTEAFLISKGNFFPTAELEAIFSRKRANKEFDFVAREGELIEAGKIIKFIPDMQFKLFPINTFPLPVNQKDREGCIVQYEAPKEISGILQAGAYIVTMDPIDIDNDGGESLCSIQVWKTMKFAPFIGGDELVMEYVGRPKEDTVDTCNSIAYKMCKYYNAKLSAENDRGGKVVIDYFIKNNAYHLLMDPPERVVSGHIKNSKTLLRKKGHSMSSEEMKELGEIYGKRWLLKVRNPETGVRNMDLIPSPALYQELMIYNRKVNTDRVMAWMGAVIQMAELFNEFKEENATPKPNMTAKFSQKITNYYKK